jgi:cytochrome c oxidase subunit 4
MADSHSSTPVPVTPPHSHGGHDDAAHVSKHVRMYLVIGALLVLFTGLTVGLSYVDFGSREANIVIAMILATIKAGMVAAIFMHLKEERITIWRFLIFTGIFVCGLFFLTFLHWWDPIMGSLRTHH